MKVKIGNYSNRLICNIHSNHMNKKYSIANWPDNQDYEDHVIEVIEDGVQTVYDWVNWLWFDRRTQTVKVRIDRWDTWSMDDTLAPIILPMLVQLKETKHGAPIVDDEDVPKELKSTSAEPKEKDWDTDSNHFKRWDWVMDEMIWAFEQKCRDDWMDDYYGDYVEDQKNGSMAGSFEWIDDKGRDAHQKRMSNGFKLFGKYFENLWD
jgi:hypothetical protein